jgi:hypothetical protein
MGVFVVLLLGAAILAWVGYVQFQGFQASSFPVSVALLHSEGTMPRGASVEPSALETLGFSVCATSTPARREYVVRPANYWEKRPSAAPRDLMSGALLVLHGDRWSLVARKGVGPWLFFAVAAGGIVVLEAGSATSLAWAVVVVIAGVGDWWGSRQTYRRLGLQLASLVEGGVQQSDEADKARAG